MTTKNKKEKSNLKKEKKNLAGSINFNMKKYIIFGEHSLT